MALAFSTDVREVGRLPDQLTEAVIRPHLDAAARELARWIGDYEAEAAGDDGISEAKRAAVVEAECCITMAFGVPVWNTFYTAGMASLTKEVGEMDFIFHSPRDLDGVVRRWMDRARGAVADYLAESDLGWVAI